jgi:hypothetical protein
MKSREVVLGMANRVVLAGLFALSGLLVVAGPALAAVRPTDALYAEKAALVDKGDYSNGAIGLVTIDGGTKLQGGPVDGSGVACYTGANPPEGVPANTVIEVRVPHDLPISGNGSFSFSGPVTLNLTPEQTGYEEATFKTTYTIKGRFKPGKHGTYTASGTDSSPVCQPGTVTKFQATFVEKVG